MSEGDLLVLGETRPRLLEQALVKEDTPIIDITIVSGKCGNNIRKQVLPIAIIDLVTDSLGLSARDSFVSLFGYCIVFLRGGRRNHAEHVEAMELSVPTPLR